MRLMISNRGGNALVRLGGTIEASDRSEALEKLSAALEMGKQTTLDLSGLTEIDTAGLQILLVIRQEAQNIGKVLLFSAIPEPVAKVLRILDIENLFQATST